MHSVTLLFTLSGAVTLLSFSTNCCNSRNCILCRPQPPTQPRLALDNVLLFQPPKFVQFSFWLLSCSFDFLDFGVAPFNAAAVHVIAIFAPISTLLCSVLLVSYALTSLLRSKIFVQFTATLSWFVVLLFSICLHFVGYLSLAKWICGV